MLVGFFKSASDAACHCRIIEFCDRIWLSDQGAAQVRRFFTLEVGDSAGNAPLTDVITVLVPRRTTVSERVRNLNPTCFDPVFHFNTGMSAGYEVTSSPKNDGGWQDHGVINLEGLKDVRVYAKIEPGVTPIGTCDGIRIRFPEPLPPGTRAKVRIGYEVGSLWTNISPPENTPVYEVRLNYFRTDVHEDSIGILGGFDNQIRVLPTLGGDRKGGGFDIFLYYPPGLVSHQPHPGLSGTEVQDRRDPDGTEGSSRAKRMWRLRELVDNPTEPVGTGSGYDLVCRITFPFDQPAKMKELKQEVESASKKTKGLKTEVRIATLVAIAAICVAFVPLLHLESRRSELGVSSLIILAVLALGWIVGRLLEKDS